MIDKLDMVVFEAAGSSKVIQDTNDTENKSVTQATEVNIKKLLGFKD